MENSDSSFEEDSKISFSSEQSQKLRNKIVNLTKRYKREKKALEIAEEVRKDKVFQEQGSFPDEKL